MSSEPSSSRVHPFDALATIGCIYLALVTFGFAAFTYLAVLPAGASHNRDRAFFSSANVVSLTGFDQVTAAVANYPTLGLIVVSSLVLISALTSLIGGGYLLARAVGSRVTLSTLAVWSAGILALPLVCAWMIGGFNAISATTGLGVWGRPRFQPIGETVALGLAALGFLGVVPIRELIWPDRSPDCDRRGYVRWSLVAIAALILAGIVLLVACGVPWEQSAVRSIALRAFGGAAGPRLNASPAMPWVAMVLSLIGAAPASTAGGLSVVPIIVVIRGAIDASRGRSVDRLLGIALAWIASFAIAIVVFTIAVDALAPALPAERILMLVCSALGNIGISYEPVGITGASLFALSAAMLFGRLLPFVMLAWMACVAECSPVIQRSAATKDLGRQHAPS